METILALLGLGLIGALWSKIGGQKRELERWRRELWGVQRAGAHLEHRVIMLEAWGHNVHARLAAPAVEPEQLPPKDVPAWRAPTVDEAGAAPPDSHDTEAESSPMYGPIQRTQEANEHVDPTRVEEAAKVVATDPPRASLGSMAAAEVDEEEPVPSSAAHDPKPIRKPVSLEQWLGVRGAAALGAAVLVLAGIYFFKYSIDNELLTTTMRVALGAGAGVIATAGAEFWLRKRHALLANFVTGAGLAIFYLTFWAAYARYDLIGGTAAGGLMMLVTAASCAMSIRRSSLAIASLGLVGGFATPVMLSTGSDRPLVLFSYLFLLDAALLLVAYKRRWPGLALLSLIGTSGYQGLWLVARMGPERLGLGMALCGMFALLYTFAGDRRRDDEPVDELWRATRAAALVIPLGFAFYLSAVPAVGATFWHVAMLLTGMLAGAAVIAHRQHWPRFLKAALFPSLCVLGTWLFCHGVADAWLVGLFCVTIAALLQAATELQRDTTGNYADGASGWIVGSMVITVVAVVCAPTLVSPWPWLSTWLVLALIGMRNGADEMRAWSLITTAAMFGVGMLVVGAKLLPDFDAGRSETYVGFSIALVVAYQLATLLLSYPATRRRAADGSALLPVMLLLMLPIATEMRTGVYMFTSVVLVALTALPLWLNGRSTWLVVSAALAVVAQWFRWSSVDLQIGSVNVPWEGATRDVHHLAWLAHGAVALLVSAWPLVSNQRVRDQASAWRAAALAPLIAFLPMAAIQRRVFGQTSTALLAIAFGTVSVAVLIASRYRGPREEAVQKSRTAWLGAGALVFATIAIPLALEHEWLTIGWALLATALLALWRRVDHAGLKYVALALNAMVFMRLLFVFEVATYHPEVGVPVLNWLLYTYLVPTACFAANALILMRHEAQALRKWEPKRGDGTPITAMVYGAGAIALGFVWLNLTIIDVFNMPGALDLELARMPTRDLTMSLSWAAYGLVLLGVGMWKKAGALRKASLALILITCGKVFLFDLSHLRDLHRVMSLTGLALSLIAVSFAYHRFVFREPEAQA